LQEGDDTGGTTQQQQSAGDYKDSISELLFPWDAAKYKEAVHAIPKGILLLLLIITIQIIINRVPVTTETA